MSMSCIIFTSRHGQGAVPYSACSETMHKSAQLEHPQPLKAHQSQDVEHPLPSRLLAPRVSQQQEHRAAGLPAGTAAPCACSETTLCSKVRGCALHAFQMQRKSCSSTTGSCHTDMEHLHSRVRQAQAERLRPRHRQLAAGPCPRPGSAPLRCCLHDQLPGKCTRLSNSLMSFS